MKIDSFLIRVLFLPLCTAGILVANQAAPARRTPAKPASATRPAAPATTATPPAREFGVDDVVAMLDAKLPEAVILTKIKAHGKPFTLETDELVRLKKAGATENIMLLMLDPTATPKEPAPPAAPAPVPPPAPAAAPAPQPAPAAAASPFEEIGVYYRKAGQWQELLPEIVNWKTGGVLKNIASAGVVKKDLNGNLPGPNSRNSITSPLEFTIYAPEGVAITEYQLIRLRVNKDYREFRTITGGVFNARSGAMRDMVPFEGKKVGNRLYSVILPSNIGAGEYGFIHLGSSGASGGVNTLAMGKMYTFRVIE